MYNFNLLNADTDSILVAKPDGAEFSEQEQAALIKELNSMFPEHINWDEDGYFESAIIIKAKNYVLKDASDGKIKIKGSGLKDSKKEPALKEFMNNMIIAMLNKRQDELVDIYKSYVKEALNVKDINRWCSKKTITEAITDCKGYTQSDITSKRLRKNETDVWDAVKDIEGLGQGDKVYLYPTILDIITIPGGISKKTGKPLKDKTKEITGYKTNMSWNNDHNFEKLVERVYKTVDIFSTVLDMTKFIDYSTKKNKSALDEIERTINNESI